MTTPPLDLPEPEDAFDRKLVADVHEYGWHCVLVANEHHPEHAAANRALPPHPVHDAAFAYTAGLWLTHRHAELILVGRWQHAHAILASVVSLIEDGHTFQENDTSHDVLDGCPIRFGAVSTGHRTELLTYAAWLNHRSTPSKSCSLTAKAAGPTKMAMTPTHSRFSPDHERDPCAPGMVVALLA